MTLRSPCRFCFTSLTVELPEVERMEQFVRTLATRACCNRCADYQRAQRSRGDTLQKLALDMMNAEKSDQNAAESRIREVAKLIVAKAEDHYLIAGLLKDVEMFVRVVCDQPEFARWHAEEFDRKVLKLARVTHAPKVVDYAY